MHPQRTSSTRHGFSLVEVILSLGIVSFALVAMLGLLSVGFNASKQSTEDTLISTMTSKITSELRGTSSVTAATMTTPKEYYFDAQGILMTTGTGAVYYCQATMRHPSSSEVADLGSRFGILTLDFTWPATISDKTKRPYKETIHVTIPR